MQKANIDIIKYLVKDAYDKKRPKPIIFLGAGASASAGIPLTGEIVKDVFQKFHENPRIQRLEKLNRRNYYEIMDTLTSAERHRLFRDYIEAKDVKINVTHIYLAHLLKEDYIDYIVTVNFDNLMLRACALFNFIPPVYDIAILKDLTTTTIHEKSVIHLHGQHHGLWQLNTERELGKIKQEGQNSVGNIFRQICNDRTWIVIGYGGEDGVLDEIAKLGRFDNQLFWVGYQDILPSENVRKKLLDRENSDAFWVSGYTADSFVLELHSHLGLETPLIFQKPFSFVEEVLKSVNDIDLSVEEKQHSNSKHQNLFFHVEKRVAAAKIWIEDAVQRYEELSPTNLLNDKEIQLQSLILKIIEAIIQENYRDIDTFAQEYSSLEGGINNKSDLLSASDLIGYVFGGMKKYDKAIMWYKKAIKIDNQDIWTLNNIGRAYADKKKYDTAIEWYKKAIEIDNQDTQTLNNIGRAYAHKKNYEKAIEFYKKTLDSNSENTVALSNLGWYYLMIGDIEKAKEILEQLSRLNIMTTAAINLGHCYLCEKDEQKAIVFYKKGFVLWEDDEEAFVQEMEEDYEYLVQYGITQEYYQSIINKVLHPEQDI